MHGAGSSEDNVCFCLSPDLQIQYMHKSIFRKKKRENGVQMPRQTLELSESAVWRSMRNLAGKVCLAGEP
jgi:hypothetical protein